MPLPERSQIAHLRRMVESRLTRDPGRGTANSRRQSRPAIIAGIGDDCAVIRFPAGLDSLVTTDFTLENIHFRRDWHPAKAVGHRCLSRGLSDIAAMGGQPVAAFLSLALPRDLSQSWVRAFTSGLVKLAGQHGVVLAGVTLRSLRTAFWRTSLFLAPFPRVRPYFGRVLGWEIAYL